MLDREHSSHYNSYKKMPQAYGMIAKRWTARVFFQPMIRLILSLEALNIKEYILMLRVPKRRSAPSSQSGARQAAREVFAAALALAALALPSAAAPGEAHGVPLAQMRAVPTVPRTARTLGHLEAGTRVPLSISLPLRDQAGLQDLLTRLYDPNDALYHHFLTQPEFAQRFGPTQADYDAVITFAKANGLSVVQTSKTRSLVDVVGTREAVEAAFSTPLTKYQMADGRIAYANTTLPRVPQSIASKIASVVGLDTVDLYQHPHLHRLTGEALRPMIQAVPTWALMGTGPNGGLAPADIKTAYSLTSVAPVNLTGLTGKGQTLGLYELDGYLPSDIQGYASQFNLPTANLRNVLYQGFSGTPGTDTGEVVLDIEMMLALAPNANIVVYEAQNATTAATSLYQKIADDNLAKSVSTSFGLDEAGAQSNGAIAPETAAFQQMQAQGQSLFAAAGDNGAFDDGKTISVDDPAANPAVTGVGGTKLTINANQGYVSETTWNREPKTTDGGGGGVSTLFTIPTYQAGIKTAASQTRRNVPDVSLNSDPQTGYAVYLTDPATKTTGFAIIGGTSAAAPLWAAFTGLINEQRSSYGLNNTVGFINPALYTLAQSGDYAGVFHDINDGSDNLKYVAAAGYDNATGLGTFIGDQLLDALSPSTNTPVTLTGTVLDTSGKPVPNVSISITTLQISHFVRSPATTGTYDPATGKFTQVLDTQMAADATTGTAKALTYTVSADAPNLAGQTVSVTPAQTQQVALILSPSQYTFSSEILQMVSAPYEYSGAGDFATLFGLTAPLTGTGHNLVAWSPTQSAYLYYPTFPADTFHLGQGYWTKLPASAYIRRLGTPAPTGPFHISLQQGWNQIGDPFLRNVTVSDIQVSSPATASSPNPGSSPVGQSSLVALPLYAYSTSSQSYTTLAASDQMQPWQGYWIYANQPAVLTVPGS